MDDQITRPIFPLIGDNNTAGRFLSTSGTFSQCFRGSMVGSRVNKRQRTVGEVLFIEMIISGNFYFHFMKLLLDKRDVLWMCGNAEEITTHS